MPFDDIVTRLRLRPTILWKNQFGDMETDRAATALFDDCHAIMREAADEIERLRNELTERIHMCDMRSEKIIELTAERDEARRLLKAVVDITLDNMVHDANPKHLCDFVHRPDIAMCKVCEDWTDAMVMCYPHEFQDEEDKS